MATVLFGFKDKEVDVRCVRRINCLNLWSKQVHGFLLIVDIWLSMHVCMVRSSRQVWHTKFFSSFDS